MSDFNWADYESNDDDLFGRGDNDNSEEQNEWILKMHRIMFIDDIERKPFQVIPLDPVEFVDLFGKITDDDKYALTQAFIKDYLRWEQYDFHRLYDKWGLSWIEELKDYNERVEEYELCSIFKEVKERVQLLPLQSALQDLDIDNEQDSGYNIR